MSNFRSPYIIIMKRFIPLFVLLVLISCAGQEQIRYEIGVSQCSSDAWRSKMNKEMYRETMRRSIAEAHNRAVEVSAYVCTQNGAMPLLPDYLKD